MGKYNCINIIRRLQNPPAPNQRSSWLKRLLSKVCCRPITPPRHGVGDTELIDVRRTPIPSGDELEGEERAWNNIVRYVWQSNFNAPVQGQLENGGANVLDVCCETGEWTLNLARDYPKSSFVGIDAAKRNQWSDKPDNVIFLDVSPEFLPFGDEAFDFVRIHCHTTDYAQTSWERVILPSLVRVLKPDGYLEICVTDLTLYGGNGTTTEKVMNAYQVYRHAKNNRQTSGAATPPQELQRMLQAQSTLTDITRNQRQIRVGQWGDAIGEVNAQYWIDRWRDTPELATLLVTTNDIYQNQLSTVIPTEISTHRTWLLNERLTARKIARTTNDTR